MLVLGRMLPSDEMPAVTVMAMLPVRKGSPAVVNQLIIVPLALASAHAGNHTLTHTDSS